MSLRREPPLRLLPVVVPLSKDEHLLQSGIAIGQVGLYFVQAPASVCFFVVTLVSAR
jgi:hypothetical protein